MPSAETGHSRTTCPGRPRQHGRSRILRSLSRFEHYVRWRRRGQRGAVLVHGPRQEQMHNYVAPGGECGELSRRPASFEPLGRHNFPLSTTIPSPARRKLSGSALDAANAARPLARARFASPQRRRERRRRLPDTVPSERRTRGPRIDYCLRATTEPSRTHGTVEAVAIRPINLKYFARFSTAGHLTIKLTTTPWDQLLGGGRALLRPRAHRHLDINKIYPAHSHMAQQQERFGVSGRNFRQRLEAVHQDHVLQPARH